MASRTSNGSDADLMPSNQNIAQVPRPRTHKLDKTMHVLDSAAPMAQDPAATKLNPLTWFQTVNFTAILPVLVALFLLDKSLCEWWRHVKSLHVSLWPWAFTAFTSKANTEEAQELPQTKILLNTCSRLSTPGGWSWASGHLRNSSHTCHCQVFQQSFPDQQICSFARPTCTQLCLFLSQGDMCT